MFKMTNTFKTANTLAKPHKLPLVLALLLLITALAGCGGDSAANAADPLTGTAWIADNDGSQWIFRDDGSFSWYQNKAVVTDNYYAGTYQARLGTAALDFLEKELADFNHTRQGAENLIKSNNAYEKNYNTDNFICLSCTNTSFMLQGEEQLTEPWPTAYYGFLVKDEGKLVLLNLTTSNWYWFTQDEAE